MKKDKSLFKLAIEYPSKEVVSTGFIQLDDALGGGLVLGSIIEIFGDESEGKTTLGLSFLKNAQKQGFKTLFLDLEHCISPDYLAKIVDLNSLYLGQPLSVEETFEAIIKFIDMFPNDKKMILVDSVAAMSTDREVLEGEDRIAAVASVLNRALKDVIRKYDNSIIIFTNQTRDVIGSSGKLQRTPGGNALKFYAGHRLEIYTKEQGLVLDSNRERIGKEIVIYVVKNKFGRPFGKAILTLYFGEGFSVESDLFNYAESKGIIEKSGAWIKFEDKNYQGKENFINEMKNDRSLYERIREKCEVFRKNLQ